jgi:hypothetical protein
MTGRETAMNSNAQNHAELSIVTRRGASCGRPLVIAGRHHLPFKTGGISLFQDRSIQRFEIKFLIIIMTEK